MFIGIIGSHCSGKHTIAKYLVEKYRFTFVYIKQQHAFHKDLYEDGLNFASLEEMQQYVTERWDKPFVTCDIDNHGIWTLK